jgi:hypothetical protein
MSGPSSNRASGAAFGHRSRAALAAHSDRPGTSSRRTLDRRPAFASDATGTDDNTAADNDAAPSD